MRAQQPTAASTLKISDSRANRPQAGDVVVEDAAGKGREYRGERVLAEGFGAGRTAEDPGGLLPLLDGPGSEIRENPLRRLAAVIRSSGGVNAIATPQVRARARVILAGGALPLEAEHLLKRIANGGPAQAGNYDLYLGTNLLATWTPKDLPDDVLKAVARVSAERFELLLLLPELLNYSARPELEGMISRAIKRYREVNFAAVPARAIDPVTVEVSLLPESDIVDELVFMAVTQVCETIFQGTADILATAEREVAYAHARQASHSLMAAGHTLALLQQAGGVLAPMPVERWRSLREFIELPSAIQSESYRRLLGHLWGVTRILGHDRYPEWEQQHVRAAGEALVRVTEVVQRWEMLHLGLAKKYGSVGSGDPLPDTLVYLERQLSELKDVIGLLQRRHSGAAAT